MSFIENLKIYYNETLNLNPQLVESEIRVMDLFLLGKSNLEIAQFLYISPLTVKTHFLHVYQKFGLSGKTTVKRPTLAIAYLLWKENKEKEIAKISSGHPKI